MARSSLVIRQNVFSLTSVVVSVVTLKCDKDNFHALMGLP